MMDKMGKAKCIHRPLVFMFSGQGSQYYHMAAALFRQHASFKAWMKQLDLAARRHTGVSVLERIYDAGKNKSDIFKDLLHSSLAIFFIEYALARILIEDGIQPSAVVGASLGEFTAQCVTGMANTEQTIELISKKATLMEKYRVAGGMLAILANVQLFNNTPDLNEKSELAAVNFDEHFIVSGKQSDLDDIQAFLSKKGIIFQKLGVAAAYHSSLMDSVASEFKIFLKKITFKSPHIKYYSCATGGALEMLPQYHIWDVIRKPILFQDTIRKIEKNGDSTYLDLGPSGTLSTFVKYNLSEQSASQTHMILNPFRQDIRNYKKIILCLTSKRTAGEKKMLTYVFPGQGSQAKGMGGSLFDEFRGMIERAEGILGYSIRDLCANDPQQKLGMTQYTQVAVYVTSALSYFHEIKNEGLPIPDFFAGHSLGEYNALLAAGVFDFETGLQLVKKRGELMAQAENGAMAVVVKLDEKKVAKILDENGLTTITIANYNTPSQFVIAGPKVDIDRAAAVFHAAKAICLPLNVSGAFHTRYMQAAKEEFGEFIKSFDFFSPQTPVISNVTARPYNPAEIKTNLIEQITSPVKWSESICYLMRYNAMTFKEIGYGNVLTGMIRSIEKESEPLKVAQFDDRSLSESGHEDTAQSAGGRSYLSTDRFDDHQHKITAEALGCEQFRKDYNLKYAYVTGSMYRGIASKDLVLNVCKAGMLGCYGTGGLDLETIEDTIRYLRGSLEDGRPFGMNLMAGPLEKQTVDLYLNYKVRHIEASAYMQLTPALVRYRLKGLRRSTNNGAVEAQNRIMAKVSRPEVAELFFSPPPERIIDRLLAEGAVTPEEAQMAGKVPMADDLCVEADSGGHTDKGVAYALMPAIMRLRDDMMIKYRYPNKIRLGAAGGIGTPEAAACAFILGADFILTGSINQCTVEAGTSDSAKDLLQQMNVQDTDYAPAGDMFELGAKVQVLRKGLFFPARANKLYNLYLQYNSLDEIDEKTRKQIMEKYFRRSFDDIYTDVRNFFKDKEPVQIERAEKNPKHKMALIFRWYFNHTTNLALHGIEDQKVDYQIHCGPALGAFNQWVKGTAIENWRNRKVAEIGVKMMVETANLLNRRFRLMTSS